MRFVKVARGSSRFVLLIPRMGIVIKIGKVRARLALRRLRLSWRRDGLRGVRKDLSLPIHWITVRGMLFKGIKDNMLEARFSRSFHSPLIARTYVSLGIINVQKFVGSGPLTSTEHWKWMEDALDWKVVSCFEDLHAIDVKNFGELNGHICALDYASVAMQKLLRQREQDWLRGPYRKDQRESIAS